MWGKIRICLHIQLSVNKWDISGNSASLKKEIEWEEGKGDLFLVVVPFEFYTMHVYSLFKNTLKY